MGCVTGISFDEFPKQSDYVGKLVKVCFNYDSSKWIHGVVVRDDRGAPGETIIRLADGRYVRSVECQYSFVD